MKTRCSLAGALVTVILFPALVRAQTAAPELQAVFVDPDSAAARSYRDVGSWAIDRLAMTMITDAAKAVAQKGAVEALPVCHLKDLPMTGGVVGGMGRVVAMKLTSLKLRNPANAPDAAEQQALERVKYELYTGRPSRILVQRIDLPGEKHEWRVYKPLAVIGQCGNCHARPEEQPAELRTALAEKYPNDQASSFTQGEWRGLIRVTVADAPAPAPPATPGKAAPAAPTTRRSKS